MGIMTTCPIWRVCILSEMRIRIVLESCFSDSVLPSLPHRRGSRYNSPFRLRTRDASTLPLLCHLNSNQIFFADIFSFSSGVYPK